MSADETRQFIDAVVQHVADLRAEVGRNQSSINNANWKQDSGPALDGLRSSNEWLTKVIIGTQFLLDSYAKTGDNKISLTLTMVIIVVTFLSSIIGSVALQLLSGGR